MSLGNLIEKLSSKEAILWLVKEKVAKRVARKEKVLRNEVQRCGNIHTKMNFTIMVFLE